MDIKALDTPASDLGEGVFLDQESMKLYWVDINSSKLFQYDLMANELLRTYELKSNPSCIFSVCGSLLTYVDAEGVKEICTKTGNVSRVTSHIEHNSIEFRANDGVVLSNGCIVFGTMSFNPNQAVGKLYTLDHNKALKAYELGIRIPNTFIPSNDLLYVSDSLVQCTYTIKLQQGNIIDRGSLTLWKDFSNCTYTPDGGCISTQGYLHIALWDGSAVGVFDSSGNVMKTISLPVLRPTSCVFLGNRWLYVTSAREGMTDEQLSEYPLSGKTLVVDLGNDYEY